MPAIAETLSTVQSVTDSGYKWGFETDIEMDFAPRGLNEGIVRLISERKGEPAWLLQWRLRAFASWQTMVEPDWALLNYPVIDYQDAFYYAAPKRKAGPQSLDEVDPELLRMYEKLGIPLRERAMLAGVEAPVDGERQIAVDAVFDSVSVATTFRSTLAKSGVIFCPISEAVREHPDLVRKYLGSVVPSTDNYFAALNSAVFTDGSFVFIPKGVACPMELSTYFRINAKNTGQFERTLIIAEEGASVSYLEGCTAPMRDENQLHAAVVELVAMDDAKIKYSTVQNWYPGDANGVGGIYNFVTKRGACRGARSKISWTQVETGSAITWKYPSCILQGEGSVGEFYSVALTNNHQQADTGTKMIHIGKNTTSTIVSKGISAGQSNNTYRGLVRILPKASGARNHTQCDSLLIGDRCGAHTVPYIESRNPTARVEHEATTSKIAEDQLFYCRQRGLSQEDAVGLIVNGFCREVLKELPMEFAVEAQKLLAVSLKARWAEMLDIRDLYASIGEKPILRGITLAVPDGEIHAVMGPNGSGKSTLSYVLAGREDFTVTGGTATFDGQDLLGMEPEARAQLGLFLAFQAPVELPGVGNANFLRTALNAVRRARGEEELDAAQFLKAARIEAKRLQMPDDMLRRNVNVGFSGGEKKRNEVLQMTMLRPKLAILDETDSGLDIDALKIVGDGVNALRAPGFSALVITHHQRLLDHIVPDCVHVLAHGRIVRSGGADLARALEAQGYAQVIAEAA